MRVIGLFLSGLVLGGILAGIVWWSRYSGNLTPAERVKLAKELHERDRANAEQQVKEAEAEAHPDGELPPPVSEKGPYPKAVAGDRLFEFDSMGVNERREHTFTIRNEGEAPLLLTKGATSCKCTISGLSKKELATGETAEINLVWIPRDVDMYFGKEAIIQTNDPENLRIKFQIKGKVVQKYLVAPSAEWDMGMIAEGSSGEVFGSITSQLYENFKILGVESSHPLLTIEHKPMPEARLKQFAVKSGYEFSAKLPSGIPVGPFGAKVNIKTDIDGETNIDIKVRALRPGPLRFLPAIGGAQWNRDTMSLNMGRFPASEGKKVSLPMFVSGMEGEFKLLTVEPSDKFLKVTLESEAVEDSTKQRTYFLKFEIPGGSPAMSRNATDPVRVKMKTNHPQAEDIEIDVLFISL